MPAKSPSTERTAQERLLEVDRLSVRFKTDDVTITAVDGVSLSVDRGQTVAVVGESGSGKSVTSLAIMRLLRLPPTMMDARAIKFRRRDGNFADLSRLPEREMRDIRGNEIAMIFQEPMTCLNPVFSVGRQITETITAHQGTNRQNAMIRAGELLAALGISDPERRLRSFPHQLSGGMRQRIMIAMALACRPALLIADEPTTALDVTVQAQILELIMTLQKEMGMALLFITHNLGVAAEISDRIVVMYAGRVVEEGDTRDIFAAPRHPYTRGLLPADPFHGYAEPAPRLLSFRRSRATCRCQAICRPVAHSTRAVATAGMAYARPAACTSDRKPCPSSTAFSACAGATSRRRYGQPQRPSYWKSSACRSTSALRRARSRAQKQVLRAVDGVSFEIARGEVLGLVGRSGSGKSKVGRSILRPLTEPTSGEIRFDGQDILALRGGDLRRFRRHAQIIFQDPLASLNPRMTVEQLLAEPLVTQGMHPRPRRVARAARNCSGWSGWHRRTCHATRTPSPAASASVSRSPAAWPCDRISSSPTSPCPRSTCRSRPRSSTCCVS